MCPPACCLTGGHVWVPPAGPSPQAKAALPVPAAKARVLAPLQGERAAPRVFPHFQHSVWAGRPSYFRLSRTHGCDWCDLKAVCSRHPSCGRSRSCRSNRPIGELWAFLDFMHDPSCTSKAAHVAYRPSFETRVEARARFKALGNSAEVLNAEAVLADGSDEPP